eukprot:1158274-Pelagomonas_calceolata.AAC.37
MHAENAIQCTPRLQRAAEDSTEKRTKDTYGPPMGKRLIMFIDDLNMPRVDLYGTQQPIAFLKLFIERRGMYDRGKDLSWKNVKDVQVIGRGSCWGGGAFGAGRLIVRQGIG